MVARVMKSRAMRTQLMLIAIAGLLTVGICVVFGSWMTAATVVWGWVAALSSAGVCYRLGWVEGRGTTRQVATFIMYMVDADGLPESVPTSGRLVVDDLDS